MLFRSTPKLYIGGKQARPNSGYSITVLNAHKKAAGEVGHGNRKDIRNAVEAAAALDAALHDGEDHELVATSDIALPGPWVRVGEIESGEGLRLTSRSGIAPSLEGRWSPSTSRGWTHGAPRP